MVEKLQIIDDRANSFGNDVASILFQLRKLRIDDIPDIYIYLEKLCEQNLQQLNRSGLLLLLQSFGTNYVHSKSLFSAAIERLGKTTNNFESLLPHEYAILMHSFTQLQVVNFLSSDLI